MPAPELTLEQFVLWFVLSSSLNLLNSDLF